MSTTLDNSATTHEDGHKAENTVMEKATETTQRASLIKMAVDTLGSIIEKAPGDGKAEITQYIEVFVRVANIMVGSGVNDGGIIAPAAGEVTHTQPNQSDTERRTAPAADEVRTEGMRTPAQPRPLNSSFVAKQPGELTLEDILKSVTDEAITCFEDGREYRVLKRALSRMGMTPEQYRNKWGLPDNYPLIAPAYSRVRQSIARNTIAPDNGANDTTQVVPLASQKSRPENDQYHFNGHALPESVTTILSKNGVTLPTVDDLTKATVFPNEIICLEDGEPVTLLKWRLKRFDMSEDQYRAKWGLPGDYPMTPAKYSETRRSIAQTMHADRKAEMADESEHPVITVSSGNNETAQRTTENVREPEKA